MKVGLIDVDGHAKKKKFGATVYPNLALCKISAWHKAQGDEVVWYDPMFTGHCDKVYISKIFNFTPDVDFMIDADEVIRGGTGYDVQSCLPVEVDMMQPDYDIYPLLPKDVAYGWRTLLQEYGNNGYARYDTLKELSRSDRTEDTPPHLPGVCRKKRAEELSLEGKM